MTNNYNTITELPGSKITKTQLQRAHQRYVFAGKYCKNNRVMEIGCGAGQGLEILSLEAMSVLGCDIDDTNIKISNNTYSNHKKIDIRKMDAEKLKFEDNSFEVIILFETIYYLKDVTTFLRNVHRILSKNGYLIICTANKDWPEFNPSPYSIKYFSVPEIFSITSQNGFVVKMMASFPDIKDNLLPKILSVIKRIAVKLNIMPKTMKGKLLLKKLFMGEMVEYPLKLTTELFNYKDPVNIPVDKIDTINTAIFAVCKKNI